MVIARRGLTLDEFLALPEEEPALEYRDGVVTRKVAPKGPHSALQTALLVYLTGRLVPEKIGRPLGELRTTYRGASFVPDIAVYRWDRVPRDPTGRIAADFLVPPDVAIEIRSPGQSRAALVRRCEWYVANGVHVALLLDDQDESIRVFRPGVPPVVCRGSDRIALPELAPDLELVVDEVFSALRHD